MFVEALNSGVADVPERPVASDTVQSVPNSVCHRSTLVLLLLFVEDSEKIVPMSIFFQPYLIGLSRLFPFFLVRNRRRTFFPHFLLKILPVSLLSEDEEDGSAEAERGPDEIEAEFFSHEEQGGRHEDGQRDDFLHDLQLGERERGIADAVRRHLKQVFEQGNPPTDDCGQPPRLARHVF